MEIIEMKNRVFMFMLFVAMFFANTLQGANGAEEAPKFKVLVLTERGGQHGGFTDAALTWLKDFAKENQFEVMEINNTSKINEAFYRNSKYLSNWISHPTHGVMSQRKLLNAILKRAVAAGWDSITPPCWAILMAIRCGTGFPTLWEVSGLKTTLRLPRRGV